MTPRAYNETINGVNYTVVSLYGSDYDGIKSSLASSTANGNYKYVMNADLDLTTVQGSTDRDHNVRLYGQSVIWDLNGHTIRFSGWGSDDGDGDYLSYFSLYCSTFELTDSSANHQGTIESTESTRSSVYLIAIRVVSVTYSGGKVVGNNLVRFAKAGIDLIMMGGEWQDLNYQMYNDTDCFYPGSTYVAPWMTATYNDSNGQVTAASGYPPHDLSYQVIFLDGDYDSNSSKLAPVNATGNYLYVMTADLDLSTNPTNRYRVLNLYGQAVIWDLNGYTLTMSGWQRDDDGNGSYSSWLHLYCHAFELADSSAERVGKVVTNADPRISLHGTAALEKITLSGGTWHGACAFKLPNTVQTNLEITGGGLPAIKYEIFDNFVYPAAVAVADYMVAEYDGDHLVGCYDSRYYEKINGLVHKVVKLTGDYSQVCKLINAATKFGDLGNYKYVMTADLNLDATQAQTDADRFRVLLIYGNAVIWDLNGYTLTTSGWQSGNGGSDYDSVLRVDSTTFTLVDDSLMHTGKVVSSGLFIQTGTVNKDAITVTLAGGELVGVCTIKCLEQVISANTRINFTGGKWGNLHYVNIDAANEYVAPYLDATYDSNGHVTSAVPYNLYTVSTSDAYSGAYNYVYGLAWNLDVWTLQKLTLPTDQVYHLWVRNGAEWYQYSGVCYANGAWQVA